MRVGLAAVGFTSTIAQVLLMRELVATFYGNELLFGLVLAVWMMWVAIGSWGMPRLLANVSRRSIPSARQNGNAGLWTFAAGLVVAAAVLPIQVVLVRGVRPLLGVTPGAFVELVPMVGALGAILCPLCLTCGYLFSLGARAVVTNGGSAGQAYAWESTGSLAGGAFFSFVAVTVVDPFQTALLVSAVDLTVAAALFISRRSLRLAPLSHRAYLSVLPYFAMLGALSVAGLALGRSINHATLHAQWSDLAFAGDSPYGRLVIQARDGQRVFFENGLLAFETQSTFPELTIMMSSPSSRNDEQTCENNSQSSRVFEPRVRVCTERVIPSS